MAFSVNNEQGFSGKTGSYTPPSVADPALIVIVGSEDLSSNDPITAVDFGGTALTLAVTGSGGPDTYSATQRTSIWYLTNPGTSALTITITGGEAARTGFKVFTLGGVAQSSPVDVTDTTVWADGAVENDTTSATTTVDNTLVVSGLCHASDATFNATGATQLTKVSITSAAIASGTSTQATAGTYSHLWGWSGGGVTRGAIVSAAFKEATGGGGLTPVTKTSTLKWDALNAIVQTSTLQWSVLNAISKNSTLLWSVLNSAQIDSSIKWDVFNAIQADSTLRWNVESALSSVTQTSTLKWDTLESVQTNSTLQWRILSAVQQDSTLLWDTLSALQVDSSLKWEVLNAITQAITLRWDVSEILASVTQTTSLRWDVLSQVGATTTLRWTVEENTNTPDIITGQVVINSLTRQVYLTSLTPKISIH